MNFNWENREEFKLVVLHAAPVIDVMTFSSYEDEGGQGRYPRRYLRDKPRPFRTLEFRSQAHTLSGVPFGTPEEMDAAYSFLASCRWSLNDMTDADDKTKHYGYVLEGTFSDMALDWDNRTLYVDTDGGGDKSCTQDLGCAFIFAGSAQRDGEARLMLLSLDRNWWKARDVVQDEVWVLRKERTVKFR